MFQHNYNSSISNMNFANTEAQNMYQRSVRALPREIQYSNGVQHNDANANRRRHMYQPPPLAQPSTVFQTNSLTTRQAESLRVQARNTASPSPNPNRQIPSTAVNLNSSIVSVNTSMDTRRGSNNVTLVNRDIQARKDNVPPITVPTNNSLVAVHSSASSNATSSTNMDQNLSNATAASNNLNVKLFGSTENEKFFIFTGTVERVIKWNKIFQNHFCFFEVIASVISIQEGTMRTQKIMLLRDKKGPILQVVYYNITTHMDIEDFHVGQVLRCVGKMTAPNILNAVSIRTATDEEIETLQRLCLVCDHAVSHFLNA